MKRLRRPTLAAAGAMVALAVTACGAGGDSDVAELDLTSSWYVQPGTDFWDGWHVPEGTVLLASPFPDALEKGRVGAEFLVTGDPYAVMRDLHAQVEERGMRPEVADWSGWEVCSESEHDGLSCSLYGRNEEDHVQFEAELQVVNPPMRGEGAPQRLLLFFGEDFRGSDWAEWTEAVPPEGQAPVQPAEIDAADLAPGAELPYYGFDEPLGEIPDGAQMLAPSHHPGPTYGFHGVFALTDDTALQALEDMAAEVATGERFADSDLTVGDLTMTLRSWDGSAGGCGIDLNTMELRDYTYARFTVICD